MRETGRVVGLPAPVVDAHDIQRSFCTPTQQRQSACGCAGGYQQTVLYWMAVVQAALLAWSVFVHVKA